MPEMSWQIAEALQEEAENGKISCETVFQIANRLGCSLKEMGEVANETSIKIIRCQLGCF